ncbi:hypothetical protein AAVH_32089 [Aphelenchoides avenae]|nr:hypothetical protein AAVH_32089 [Aphelenchus avenae]
MDVDVFELLRAFPCIRSISRQTLRFLGKHFHGGEHGKVDGILLGQLSSAGIREIGALVDHGGLTDEAVLDFLFANRDDADAKHPRRFELRGAKSLSPHFVSKLVKACRDCANNDSRCISPSDGGPTSICVISRSKCAWGLCGAASSTRRARGSSISTTRTDSK